MLLLFFAVHLSVVLCQPYYSNHWAVKIDGGIEVAKDVASQHGFEFLYEIIPGYYSFKHRSIRKRSVGSSHHHHSNLVNNVKVEWAEQQVIKKRVKRDFTTSSFSDPMWPQMWYLNSVEGYDMNVRDVYLKYNITGRGIHVSILDDGLERDHPDLINNYDPGSSYDVNSDDDDPQPVYDDNDTNRHGTRCAGEVAAEANNTICSIGIAYNARIGGVRMLDGDVTDSVEGKSLGLNPQHIDIYSVSWGPEDNGKTVDGPGPLARKAIFDGIVKGRNKLGNIFVWASGNGGIKGDSCSCDGYTNLIYTLSISSASQNGRVPWYSEPCASTLASTYSSGSEGEDKIITTDLRRSCTTEHTGTSASAPLAAGICALVLEANRHLTWRDMQYIVFLTARQANLISIGWATNGVGRNVSHNFGYGLMDATAMVEAALTWIPLPDHRRCATSIKHHVEYLIQKDTINDSIIVTDGCQNTSDSIVYLEHVECTITLQARVRGEVEIFLTSPMGTRSQLLIKRYWDFTSVGFQNWTFMTTHCWGENPAGEWKLEIKARTTLSRLDQWNLVFYGVSSKPQVYSRYLPNIHESYDDAFSPISSTHQSTSNSPRITTTKEIVCVGNLKYLYNNTCVEQCPSKYHASLDRICQPCPDCSDCSSDVSCIKHEVRRIPESVIVICVVTIIIVVVTIGLYARVKCTNHRDIIDRQSKRLLHRNTFHSLNISKNGSCILPFDTIKEPLLLDDPLSSDDDEHTGSNVEP